MALSYLVAEHNDDKVVVIDADGDEDNSNVDNNNNNFNHNNNTAMTDVMSEMIMMVQDEEDPFDVQAASSTDGSSVGNNNNNNNNNNVRGGRHQGQELAPADYRQRSPTRARTPINEVGELPSLSLTASESAGQHAMFHGSGGGGAGGVGGSAVTGGRVTRVRPLSPPSRAGLDHPKVYNNSSGNSNRRSRGNNNQEEDNDDYYDDDYHGRHSGSGGARHKRTNSEENMPMDERREYRQQREESSTAAALSLCSGDDPASNFCNTTLTAMGEICGVTPGGGGSSPDKGTNAGLGPSPALQRTLSLGEKHTLAYAAGVEEQTAIEVEYVEPIYRGKDGEDDMYSPKRKNALLKAMAKKARDEFRLKKTSPGDKHNDAAGSPSSIVDSNYYGSSSNDLSPISTENVYATFSASEKRKFLKLINTGMSPVDATARVMQERRPSAEGKGLSTSTNKSTNNDNSGSNLTKATGNSLLSAQKKRGVGLAFWKRGKDKQNKVTSASSPDSANSPRINNPVTPESSVATSAAPAPARSPRNIVVTHEIENDDDDEEEAGFAKSGISYYDAIRKDRSNDEVYNNEDDEDDDDDSPNKRKNNNNSSRLSGQKFARIGFSKLSKDEQDQLDVQQEQQLKAAAAGRDRQIVVAPIGQSQSPESRSRGIVMPVAQPHYASPTTRTDQVRHDEFDDDDDNDGDGDDEDSAYDDTNDVGVRYEEGMPDDERAGDYIPKQSLTSPPKTQHIVNADARFRPFSVTRDGEAVGHTDNKILPAMSSESLLDDADEPDGNDYHEEKKAEGEEGWAIENAMAAKLLGVAGVAGAATAVAEELTTNSRDQDDVEDQEDEQESQEPQRKKKQFELDMDTYLNSTESVSRGSFDHMSVVSGKSYKTSLTSGTNHTQSTRSRRPGQAKVRLENEKNKAKNQTKVTGWQESIQAVAANTGRVWDPEFGWKDYVDPKTGDELGDHYTDSDIEPLDRNSTREESQDVTTVSPGHTVETGPTDKVPSPAEWEAERSIILGATYSEQTLVRQPSTPSRRSKSPKVAKSPPKNDQPRGWVETMKLATANLNVEGKRWDPEIGWVGLEEKGIDVYSPADRAFLDQVAVTADSDTQDFGTIQLEGLNTTYRPDGIPKLEGQASGEEKTAAVVQLEAIADNQDSALQFLSEDEDPVMEDDHESASKSVGRYVQIAETGSVRSHYRHPSKKQEILPQKRQQQLNSMEEEQIPVVSRITDKTTSEQYTGLPITTSFESPPGSFGMAGEPVRETGNYRSVLVNVKKENLDEADFSMFPPTEASDRGRVPVYMDDVEENQQQIRKERSSGPVDLDELDDEDSSDVEDGGNRQLREQDTNESFGMNSDFSWDAEDASNEVQHHRKPVPRLKINIRESPSVASGAQSAKAAGPRSVASSGSVSTASKSIPKLSAPKRDTSPIRGRKSDSSKSGRRRSTHSDSGATASSTPPGSSISENQKPRPEESSMAQLAHELFAPADQAGIGNVSGDFEQSFYTRASDFPTIQTDDAAMAPTTAGGADEDEEEKLSSRVRDLHTYWEARSSTSAGDKIDVKSAEWKAFLAKKVKADIAAAAMEGNRQQLRRNGGGGGGGPDDMEERDTIFDFNESEGAFPTARKRGTGGGGGGAGAGGTPGAPQAGSFEDISDLSPIRHDESDSDFAPSEASTNIQHGGTFLQRLQACAAPIVTRSTENCGPSVPMAAHLAFLRSNPNVVGVAEKPKAGAGGVGGRAGSFNPPAGLCGRPDVIVEEDSVDEERSDDGGADGDTTKVAGRKGKSKDSPPSTSPPQRERSRSNPKSSRHSDVSSVISDEFGAKTAYFEALAMKAAVRGGSKKKRRSPGSDVGSSTSSSNASKHSEKFQQFLDRRASKSQSPPDPPQSAQRQQQDDDDDDDDDDDEQQQEGDSPTRMQQSLPIKKPPTGRDEITSRAERYASEKVEDMLDAMAGRTSNRAGMHGTTVPLDYRGRPMEEETGAFPTLLLRPVQRDGGNNSNIGGGGSGGQQGPPSSSRLAAEELAAARVEAMMQSLSARNNVEEDEGEI